MGTKKISISIMSVLFAALILIISFATINANEKNYHEKMKNDFSAEIINTENLVLTMSAITTYTNEAVSKTLTATVLPASATNKAVDWTCEWADVSNASNLSEYVTVTPASDGSTAATVTCYQAFNGNVVITVTTRESGYTATCIVTYVGKPTEMTLSSALSPSSGFYSMGLNTVYEFTISLSNPFGSVGSQFNDFTCTTSGVGSIVVGYMEHSISSGADTWEDSLNKTITLNSIADKFMTASYANGKVSITLTKTIESYYASVNTIDGGRKKAYKDKFRSYVDDCYFKVTVKENNSDVTKDINIRFNNSIVTSLQLSDSEISF